MNNTVEAKRLHLYLEGCLSAVSKVTLNTGDLGCLVRILEEFNAKSTVNPVNPPELKTAEEIAMEIDHGCVGWSPNKAHFNRVLAISIVSQAMQQAYAAGWEAGIEEAASVCEFPFPVGITPADRVRALKTKREE